MPLRYRATMKKSRSKLALCKETLRTLLDMDLRRVIGGDDTAIGQGADLTHEPVCPARLAAPRG
jgi:hypothetical protein